MGRYCLLVLIVTAGCGGTPGSMPPPTAHGTIVVQFTVSPPSDSRLAVTSGHLGIDELTVFGDVQSDRASVEGFAIDPSSTAAQTSSWWRPSSTR